MDEGGRLRGWLVGWGDARILKCYTCMRVYDSGKVTNKKQTPPPPNTATYSFDLEKGQGRGQQTDL